MRVLTNNQNPDVKTYINSYLGKKIEMYNERIAKIKKLLYDKSDILAGVYA